MMESLIISQGASTCLRIAVTSCIRILDSAEVLPLCHTDCRAFERHLVLCVMFYQKCSCEMPRSAISAMPQAQTISNLYREEGA